MQNITVIDLAGVCVCVRACVCLPCVCVRAYMCVCAVSQNMFWFQIWMYCRRCYEYVSMDISAVGEPHELPLCDILYISAVGEPHELPLCDILYTSAVGERMRSLSPLSKY